MLEVKKFTFSLAGRKTKPVIIQTEIARKNRAEMINHVSWKYCEKAIPSTCPVASKNNSCTPKKCSSVKISTKTESILKQEDSRFEFTGNSLAFHNSNAQANMSKAVKKLGKFASPPK